MSDIKKNGINVKLISTVETNYDKYGHCHIAVLYKYKDTILAWPTTGTNAGFEHALNKTFKITFSELSDEFLNNKKCVKRISYVKVI